jgi:glucosamine-6-phosphate deaminase
VQVKTYSDRLTMSRAAARHAARSLHDAIAARGGARIVVATGASQIDFLDALTAGDGSRLRSRTASDSRATAYAAASLPAVDWTRVEMFHLDEYVGLSLDHPASFRKYLLERLIARTVITRYHLLDGEHDAARTAEQVGQKVSEAPIDVAFVGVGENGHLAFNDPPADFATEQPYLIVTLDDACRQQQVGEGWFASAADVPAQAISMSVRQILKSREIICIVPDARKAHAVKACVEGEISPLAPASVLRTHSNTTLYLDRASAALLAPSTRGAILAGGVS